MSSTEITQLAAQYVNNTNRSIFLTGKAGTGKTTFLKNIVESTYKNTVVAAPTGIAAINAKGVTLHSLFQLPFGAFVPENIAFQDSFSKVNTPQSVVSGLQMHKTKRNMLREMELLIIDEVSMLRADLLDCIDMVLRYVRRKRNVPFGGVQVLFIGDLLQLPPVVKEAEWQWLSRYYKSAFFFEALALKDQPPINIELDKVYRQSNQDFIGILNHLRNNELTDEDIDILNSHHNTSFDPKPEEGYIHITTHNRIADKINEQELNKLACEAQNINAVVKGDFDERIYPVEETMTLKVDAQIMFIKNDPSGERRFFNGKIGKIEKIDKENKIVTVVCDENEKIVIEPYLWENTRYKLNEATNQIEEIVKGTFEHFPIRLAWAITVHKSQGLTFQKAIMDLSQCFAPGQMYVALSRLTSLEGLVLSKPIKPLDFNVDNAVSDFISLKKDVKTLHESIEDDTREFHGFYIDKAFNFEPLLRSLGYHVGSYSKEANRSSKQKHLAWARSLVEKSKPLKDVGDKFCKQTKNIIASNPYLEALSDRVARAKGYFESELKLLINEVDEHIARVRDLKGVKAYLKELNEVKNEFHHLILEMAKVQLLLDAAQKKEDFTKDQLYASEAYKEQLTNAKTDIKKKKPKEDRGKTKDVSLDFYKEGLSVDEIAEKRNLVRGTIEGHLAHFVREGVITTERLISNEKLENILTVIAVIKSTSSSAIKEKLGSEYSYSEIKIALAHHDFINSEDEAPGS